MRATIATFCPCTFTRALQHHAALPLTIPRQAQPQPQQRRAFSTGRHTASSDVDLTQWQSFHTAGLKFLSAGAWEKASLLFMSAMREQSVKDTVYQYLSLANLGTAFRHMGKEEEARQVLLQSLHALKTYPSVTDGMVANLYREAALACEAMGGPERMQEAEDLLMQSLHYYAQEQMSREHAKATDEQSAKAATSVASPAAATAAATKEKTEQAKLMLETAATHYTLSLLIHKTATAASSSSSSSNTLVPTTSLAVQLRLREAQKHVQDAINLMRAVYGSDPTSKPMLSLAPVLASGGTICRLLRQPEPAQALWMEALEIYQAQQDPRLVELLQAYMELLTETNAELAEVVQAQVLREDAKPAPAGEKRD
jgi:tetratricopeptide (TPR) repeat protein